MTTITPVPIPTTDPAPSAEDELLARAALAGADLAPGVAERDRTGDLPAVVVDRLRAAGLTTMLVPADNGGGGHTHEAAGAALRALAAHDPATAVTLSMHTHLVAQQVWRHHQGLDASAVFAKVVDGAFLVSTGASDWLGSSGTARRVDGGYRVTARKAPASGCEVGQVAVTSVRWDDAPDGPSVLHCSIPLSAEGVSIERTWDTLGLRATGSHTIVFDEVFVPDAAVPLVRPADVWHPVWTVVVAAAMPLIMAAYVGIADAAVEAALALCDGRDDPATVQALGAMANAHVTAEDGLAGMFVAAEDLRFAATDALAGRVLARKTVVADAVIATVRLAIEAVGGRAYGRTSDLERLLRDVHGANFHPLPRTRQLLVTGRVALGLGPVEATEARR